MRQLPPGSSGLDYSTSLAALHAPVELAPAALTDAQGQYVPARKRIQTGVESGFTKETIAADDCEKWSLAEFSVPGARILTIYLMTAILNTGLGPMMI